MSGLKARLMYWLVLHDACPCAVADRLRLPRPLARPLRRACDAMDAWLYAPVRAEVGR